MDPLWGRFPPERRYNMDQVPLPFVNGQDETFTMEEDNDVNLKCPKESLRKRQFTILCLKWLLPEFQPLRINPIKN